MYSYDIIKPNWKL